MPIRVGDALPGAYYVGDVLADAAYQGDVQIWPIFPAVGMNKSGTHAVTATQALVQGWAADPAYAGSVVSNHGLVVAGGGSGRTVEARLAASNDGFGAATLTAVLFRNGVQIGEAGGSIPGFGSGFALVTVTGVTVAANDVITVQARSTANVTVQAANSWCRVT